MPVTSEAIDPQAPEGQVTGLRLGEQLVVPVEAVTETFAVLAKRGAGKTYTAAVLVEEMLSAGLPVVVLDPVGVWWGLRSSADGRSDGLPVVIFGGDHADLPLPETAGTLLADLVVDERVPAVLDLSGLSKSAARRFVTDFAERLYARNRDALHLVIDEADAFAPQRAQPGQQRLLGAIEDLVRRGRARGLGITLITQRPAVLHKDVLTQAEVLVALRMTGPRDVAAIDEWVRLHAEEQQAGEVKRSLPSLPVGTAWVWSPGWLGLLQRVPIRARRTFDSSATPAPGQRRPLPKRMAPVDLVALAKRLDGATEGQTQPVSPPETAGLTRRIAALEVELAAARRAVRVERVEVPVLQPGELDRLEAWAEQARATARRLTDAADRLLAAAQSKQPTTSHSDLPPPPLPAQHEPARRPAVTGRPTLAPAVLPSNGGRPLTAESEAVAPLKAGTRRMLDALARHHPMRVTRAQLATLSRFKVTGGTFATYYSTLRRRGLIAETGGLIGLTDAGVTLAGAADSQPANPAELLDQWRAALKAGARTMLDLLVAAHPASLSRGELAAAAGYEPTGGTFNTYLSMLRRNGLIDVDGERVRAADVLFFDQSHTGARDRA